MATPLTLAHATQILDHLALLKADPHKKICFYSYSIQLESSNSIIRTFWNSVSLFRSIVWEEEIDENRNLASLGPLIDQVMTRIDRDVTDSIVATGTFPFQKGKDLTPLIHQLKSAEEGLVALKENHYLEMPEKADMINSAIKTLHVRRQDFEKQKELARQQEKGKDVVIDVHAGLNKQLQEEVIRLRGENERLKQENSDLELRLHKLQARLMQSPIGE